MRIARPANWLVVYNKLKTKYTNLAGTCCIGQGTPLSYDQTAKSKMT